MKAWRRRFVIIWTGQLFSILSSSFAQFAIILWLSIQTGSASILAVATICALLPQIILGPLAGVYIDRWKRKLTMIAADGFVAFCSAVMAVLLYFDLADMWVVYLILALRSVGAAFHTPAFKAAVPMLAPKSELTRVAGVNQTIESIGMIAGPIFGALMVVWFDLWVVMLFDVVGAAIACSMLMFVRFNEPKKMARGKGIKGLTDDMRDGYRAIRCNKGLSYLMLIELITALFSMPAFVVLPLIVLQHFGGTPTDVGLTEMLFAIGTLIGGAAIAAWNPKTGKAKLIAWAYLFFGIGYVASGALNDSALVWYMILSGAMGFLLPFYNAPFTSLLQTQIEPQLLGRVFSLYGSFSMLPAMIGLLFVGALASSVGIMALLTMAGAIMTLCAIAIFAIPVVRRLD